MDTPRNARGWLFSLAISVFALTLSVQLAPGVPLSPLPAYAWGFSAAVLSSLAIAARVPLWTAPEVAAALLPSFALWWLTPLQPPSLTAAVGLSLGLWTSGTLLGAALGARIERPGHLAAVALVSSLADVWSVFDTAAPSAQLAASVEAGGPGALSRFVVPWPMLGTPYIDPMLGLGDVVFFALYLGAARAHDLSRTRMALALGLASATGLALILWLQRPLPLLPLFAVWVMLLEPNARKLEAREQRVLGVVAAGALLALSVRFW